jgi:DNA-binding MarR family transcriptional regulator
MAANPQNLPRRPDLVGRPYYTAENYASEDSIGYLIAALRNRAFRAIDIELGKLGFTAAQWPILRAVADDKTPIAADLCRKLNYDTGSMTRMLNRLEQKGVIVREPSSEDRRVVRLRMTPAGRRVYPKLRDAVVAVLNQLVSGISEADIRHTLELMRRMLTNMEYVDDGL